MNLVSWIILGLVAAAFGLAGYRTWRNMRNSGGCPGGCTGCPHAGQCHK